MKKNHQYTLRGATPTLTSWFTDSCILLCKKVALGSECTPGQYYRLSEYCLPDGVGTNLSKITFLNVVKVIYPHILL